MTGDATQAPMSRRSLLRRIGIGAGAAIAVGSGGAAARGATNGAFSAGRGAPYDLWRAWRTMSGPDAVAAAGVLAANPHNTQPWRFEITGDTIRMRSDASRRMPANDAIGREHWAGIGCAVENMAVAARGQGLDAVIKVLPDRSDPLLAATITLRAGSPPSAQEHIRAQAIAERHSNRGPFTPQPLTSTTLNGFASLPAPGERAELLLISGTEARAAVGDLIVRATQAIVADDAMSTEAFSWFRSSRSDIDRHRDGLTLDGQTLDDATLVAAKILLAQSREDGDAYWLRTTREVHTATAAAYGVVLVTDATDRAQQLAGGRLLERAHLHATTVGLGFQHMNQVTEVIDRSRGPADSFARQWAKTLGVSADRALVAFRIGRPERTARPSPRRPLDDVVTRRG